MRTLYSLYSNFPPFLPALLLILTYAFGLLIYLANKKEESQVSLTEKHIVVIISVIQSRNETIRLLCKIVSVWCWFYVQQSKKLVLVHLPPLRPGTQLVLTVTEQQFPILSPKAICLSEHGALGAPAAIPECQKTTAKLQPPFSFWETVSRIAVWGGRSICIFAWKWGGAKSLTKSLNVRERGSTAFCQWRIIAKLPCSQIQTQELHPLQREQKRLRKRVRDCWVVRNWALIQPLFHMAKPQALIPAPTKSERGNSNPRVISVTACKPERIGCFNWR